MTDTALLQLVSKKCPHPSIVGHIGSLLVVTFLSTKDPLHRKSNPVLGPIVLLINMGILQLDQNVKKSEVIDIVASYIARDKKDVWNAKVSGFLQDASISVSQFMVSNWLSQSVTALAYQPNVLITQLQLNPIVESALATLFTTSQESDAEWSYKKSDNPSWFCLKSSNSSEDAWKAVTESTSPRPFCTMLVAALLHSEDPQPGKPQAHKVNYVQMAVLLLDWSKNNKGIAACDLLLSSGIDLSTLLQQLSAMQNVLNTSMDHWQQRQQQHPKTDKFEELHSFVDAQVKAAHHKINKLNKSRRNCKQMLVHAATKGREECSGMKKIDDIAKPNQQDNDKFVNCLLTTADQKLTELVKLPKTSSFDVFGHVSDFFCALVNANTSSGRKLASNALAALVTQPIKHIEWLVLQTGGRKGHLYKFFEFIDKLFKNDQMSIVVAQCSQTLVKTADKVKENAILHLKAVFDFVESVDTKIQMWASDFLLYALQAFGLTATKTSDEQEINTNLVLLVNVFLPGFLQTRDNVPVARCNQMIATTSRKVLDVATSMLSDRQIVFERLMRLLAKAHTNKVRELLRAAQSADTPGAIETCAHEIADCVFDEAMNPDTWYLFVAVHYLCMCCSHMSMQLWGIEVWSAGNVNEFLLPLREALAMCEWLVAATDVTPDVLCLREISSTARYEDFFEITERGVLHGKSGYNCTLLPMPSTFASKSKAETWIKHQVFHTCGRALVEKLNTANNLRPTNNGDNTTGDESIIRSACSELTNDEWERLLSPQKKAPWCKVAFLTGCVRFAGSIQASYMLIAIPDSNSTNVGPLHCNGVELEGAQLCAASHCIPTMSCVEVDPCASVNMTCPSYTPGAPTTLRHILSVALGDDNQCNNPSLEQRIYAELDKKVDTYSEHVKNVFAKNHGLQHIFAKIRTQFQQMKALEDKKQEHSQAETAAKRRKIA